MHLSLLLNLSCPLRFQVRVWDRSDRHKGKKTKKMEPKNKGGGGVKMGLVYLIQGKGGGWRLLSRVGRVRW